PIRKVQVDEEYVGFGPRQLFPSLLEAARGGRRKSFDADRLGQPDLKAHVVVDDQGMRHLLSLPLGRRVGPAPLGRFRRHGNMEQEPYPRAAAPLEISRSYRRQSAMWLDANLRARASRFGVGCRFLRPPFV